ncbi:imidazole glycerol phosphate synthase subunit HisH [Bosea beijingensis]|uniref:imidazole glycerol phosphate synthase subunit HisH n=1 Tax=Bosea beijingensis TaxID=3068632 RepID=UPI002741DE24|nr:imidazole glycerol phosphate synthase subunit HisH [Bosea sp. REN20]
MITIIDYKMGNLGSILNMFRRLGIEASLTDRHEDIAKADKLLLPGVGNFSRCAGNVAQMELRSLIRDKILKDATPLLGICMGMQLLADDSEEGPGEGLGLIKGGSVKFRFEPGEAGQKPPTVPHMGWNHVATAKEHPVLAGLEMPRFYFVHSYWVDCASRQDVLLESSYGGCRFNAGIAKDTVVGVQFHPEKSHRYGMQLLSNFAAWRP